MARAGSRPAFSLKDSGKYLRSAAPAVKSGVDAARARGSRSTVGVPAADYATTQSTAVCYAAPRP